MLANYCRNTLQRTTPGRNTPPCPKGNARYQDSLGDNDRVTPNDVLPGLDPSASSAPLALWLEQSHCHGRAHPQLRSAGSTGSKCDHSGALFSVTPLFSNPSLLYRDRAVAAAAVRRAAAAVLLPSFGSAHFCIMRAAPSVAAIALLVLCISIPAAVDAAQPPEFQIMLDNVKALKVSSSTPHAPLPQAPQHNSEAHLTLLRMEHAGAWHQGYHW